VLAVTAAVAILGAAWVGHTVGYNQAAADSHGRLVHLEGAFAAAVADMTPGQAMQWARILKQNPDVEATPGTCDVESGRRYCWLKVWTTDPPPPAATPQPVEAATTRKK
jgi:hypothetical protein